MKNNLRFQPGMRQDWFALWIGSSRSLLAMYEAGKRSLTINALVQKSNIQKAWQEFENNWKPSPWAPLPENTSKLSKKYTDRIKLLRLKINVAKLNIKLRSETPDYQKAISFFENAQTANLSEIE